MSKIIFNCIWAVCILFVPFIFINFLMLNQFVEHGKEVNGYYELINSILQIVLIISVGLIIRKKRKNIIAENKDSARKYMLGSLIAFLIILLLYITEIYQDIYFTVTFSLNIDDAPLFLLVCWEQIAGIFPFAISLCVCVCFIGATKISKSNKTDKYL